MAAAAVRRPLGRLCAQYFGKRCRKYRPVSMLKHFLRDHGVRYNGHYNHFREKELEALGEDFGLYDGFKPTHTIRTFRSEFEALDAGERKDDAVIRIAGRVRSKRTSGSQTTFFHIEASTTDSSSWPPSQVQVMCQNQYLESSSQFQAITKAIKIGDVVGIIGFPGKSRKGELSIIPHGKGDGIPLKILGPCLAVLPEKLSDGNIRARERCLDLLVNPQSLQIFRIRSKVIQAVRSFLLSQDFLEVETPILWPLHGGASARPFKTLLNKGNLPLRLRVAPELFLKKLIIGGYDRVFEIGKVFRNEGITAIHNPEFTSCEFYQSYADYNDVMQTTEKLLEHVVSSLTQAGFELNGPAEGFTEIKRVDVLTALDEALNDPSFNDLDLNCPSSISSLRQMASKLHIELPEPSDNGPAELSAVVDRLISKLVEPKCISPTFLLHHPLILSPLAKEKERNDLSRNPTAVAARFELFWRGSELANAYSELADPREQRARFALQDRAREGGDIEAAPADDEFCRALEYGMPPTAGFGLGIDRLVMLLTGESHLRNVLFFPVTRPMGDGEESIH